MNAEQDRIYGYFEALEADRHVERKLMQLIDDLTSSTSRELVHSRRRSPRLLSALAAAVVTVAVASSIVMLTTRGGGHTTAGGSPARSFVTSSAPAAAPLLAPKRNFKKVVALNHNVGWASRRWLDHLQLDPNSPTEALRWQAVDRNLSVSIPVFADDLHTVIGRFISGNAASVPISCDRPVGLGLALDPPQTTVGAATPVAAARTIRTHYGITGFGTRHSPWTQQRGHDGLTPVTANGVTLNVKQLPNGSWIVVGGQDCQPPG